MIDLLDKAKGIKPVVEYKRIARKSHHPLFTLSTIKILRCVIEESGLRSLEIFSKVKVSFNHVSYLRRN